MRKFTKSLLTLALLVLAMGEAKAGVETVIKSIDYTTNPVTTTSNVGNPWTAEGYPYYSDNSWWSATATAPTLNNKSLQIVNDADNSYQLFIIDWATVKKGYAYKAKITYKSTAAGNVNLTFGTWGSSLNKEVAIVETNSWTNLLIDLGTANFVADASAHLIWKFAFAGTINIKEVEIIEVAPDVVTMTEVEKFEAPIGTTDVKNLTGTNSSWANSVVYPKEFAVQGAAFGNGDGSNESNHVNIEGYDYICFYVTTAAENTAGLRVWIWDGEAGGAGSVKTLYAYPIADYATANYATATKLNAGVGTYVTKVTGYKYLKGVKAANDWGSPASVVSMAYMCTGDPVAYTSTGATTISGTEYLADPAITCIDVTGLITKGQTLNAANPNALFIAKDGVLTNTKNVIVDGVCANLELVDGKPFKAPSDFTATAAKFTKTVSAAGYATMVIPFAANLATGVKAYNLTGVSGSTITTTDAASIAANKPVLLEAAAGDYEFTATSAAIAATEETSSNGLLNGTYVGTKAAAGASNYVLQNGAAGLGFFLVTGTDATVKPFRASLNTGTSAPEFLAFDGNTTGIESVKGTEAKGEFFNLAGQRVAQPTKGLYIVNGKKVVLK